MIIPLHTLYSMVSLNWIFGAAEIWMKLMKSSISFQRCRSEEEKIESCKWWRNVESIKGKLLEEMSIEARLFPFFPRIPKPEGSLVNEKWKKYLSYSLYKNALHFSNFSSTRYTTHLFKSRTIVVSHLKERK